MKVSFMTWKLAARIFAAFGYALFIFYAFCSDARAHDVPASNVLLDIGTYSVNAEIELPLNELREAVGIPADTNAVQVISNYHTQVSNYIAAHIDIAAMDGERYDKRVALLQSRQPRDNPLVIAQIDFTAPPGVPTSKFVFHYDAIVADVVTHNVLVSVRRDFRNGVFSDIFGGDKPIIIGLMHYQKKQLTVDGSAGSWTQGFDKVFRLGMQHIAEGIDHVLFLLVLLLSAPLGVSDHRWQKIVGVKASAWKVVKIVSGFTLGHSITLVLGALGFVSFPSTIIEVLIALSILVSALHALRPLFANREPVIAALFGLVHGMAFAGSLSGFDYDSVALALAVLGFNLGIEAMQLLIVALVLPSLLLMRVSPAYRYFRIAAATAVAVLALAWVAERGLAMSNPLNAVGEWLTTHGLLAIALLGVFAIASRMQEFVRWWRTPFAGDRRIRVNLPDPFNP
ncbi:MAG: HupE/UreJ family protein [Spongiibacteraceae bacterium]